MRVGAAVCIALMQFCHKALVLHARGPGGSKGLQGLVDCQPTGLHEVAADHKAGAIKACMANGHYWRWLQVLTYTPGIAPARLLQLFSAGRFLDSLACFECSSHCSASRSAHHRRSGWRYTRQGAAPRSARQCQ